MTTSRDNLDHLGVNLAQDIHVGALDHSLGHVVTVLVLNKRSWSRSRSNQVKII